MRDLYHFYSERKNDFTEQCEAIRRSIRKVAWARLLLALLFIVVLYLSFSNSILWYGLVPLAIFFGAFVSKHARLSQQLQRCENLVKLNELEIKSLDHSYSEFGDGSAFINPHHAYSYDLDLFGPGSLYQYLNRCGTAIGEVQLARALQSGQESGEIIVQRQVAIHELAEKVAMRQQFWAEGHLLKDSVSENTALIEWLDKPNVVKGRRGIELLLIIFPLISLVLIALCFYAIKFFPLLMVFGAVQWYVISLFSKETLKAEQALSHYRTIFEKYARLLNEIDKEVFSSEKLTSIQQEARLASDRIKKFSQLVNAFESRKNGFANLFGNSLYLFDLQCLFKLEKWRAENRTQVPSWLNKIAEMDALVSLATFHFNNPQNVFPIIDHQVKMEGKNVGHPLINIKERVANTFSLGNPQKIILVTGANMAGKSTFLRTVGVNLVLAQAGCSVCANEFSFSLMNLFTSMRATDSLVEHQSYFYAELTRLKLIMEEIRSGRPALVLLDEILRGTNSKDKQEGSIGLLKQFVSHDVLVMLASHDVALGDLEQQFPESIRNFCFESEIEKDALTFDYTLHPGVAHKANATFLMQKMGILPPQ